MTVIHRKDGGKILPNEKGDWGICTTCKKRVDHLIHSGNGHPGFNKDIIINWD